MIHLNATTQTIEAERRADGLERRKLTRPSPRNKTTGLLAILAVFYTLFYSRAVLLPTVLAILLSFLLLTARRVLSRWHLPERWGAALLLVVVTGLLGWGVVQLSDPAARCIRQAPSAVAQVQEKVRRLLQPAREL